ncbi:MAG: hypothetical protein ACTSWW_06385 [Promethearchaeota archaeon]
MVRKMNLFLNEDREIKISIKKFFREDLYGAKRTVKLDPEDIALNTLSISSDGANILPKGSISAHHFDAKENYIKKEDIILTNREGEELKKTPSIFETGIHLIEIPFQEYFNYDIGATYAITHDPDKPENSEALYQMVISLLEQDKLFKCQYAYHATHYPSEGILLPVDDNQGRREVIMVIGKWAPEVWSGSSLDLLELKQQVQKDDEDDDEELVSFEDAW